ncbi:hypothetical protein B7R22_17260 [Subtercola boreus]|uniref:Uncharacterized protein n=1 Tax=Subtercola boreus TaxID=120213 RepID=A0A3E0VQL7_9MICO|nr:hypothetical protein [Subtercola boreus]RFA12176.1 hypothetical protein B7R22_17260 [Subtercola boreus]
MPVVTGTLKDFGAATLAAFAPKLYFIPSGAAVGGATLYANKPVVCVPAANGDFSVELAANETLSPQTWYTLSIIWLDPDTGFTGQIDTDWRLFVPQGGGEFVRIIEAPSNPAQIWFGPEPPTIPTDYTGWVDTDSVPPIYYEWV